MTRSDRELTMTTIATRKPRRRTTVRQRRQQQLLAKTQADPVAEKAAINCLAWLIKTNQRIAAEIIPQLEPEWFTVEGAAEVIEAMQTAALRDGFTTESVQLAIRLFAEKDGFESQNTPAELLLVEQLKKAPAYWENPDRLAEDCRRQLEAITAAHANRMEAEACIDTLHKHGITIDAPRPAQLAAVPMRGEKLIRIRQTNYADVTDEAEQLLAKKMYVRDGRLVFVTDTKTGPAIVPATKERIADHLERVAAFTDITTTPEGDIASPTPCPVWLPARLVSKQVWPAVRELRGIANGPYVRPDGTIGGTRSGYDPETQLLTITSEDWSMVNEQPTADDVAAAVADLLDLLKDFPFEDIGGDVGSDQGARLGHSVWLSALLTLFARPAFDGPVPLFVFDATTAGSGKTLLARLLSIIAFGHEPCLAGMKDNPTELQKSLISALSRGDRLHIFDNCKGTIGNDVLDQHLTAWTVQDRRLKTNETIEAENLMMLVATSNNAAVGADTGRRTLTLRLRPAADNPEELEYDREPAAHATKNRPKYVAAALTILRWHFMHRDETPAKVRPFGSFENWSNAIRMAVIRAGLPDPLRSQDYVRQIDDGSQLRAALVDAWAWWRPTFTGTARSLLAAAFDTRPDGSFEDDGDGAEKMRAVIMDLTHCTRSRPGADEARKLGYIIRGLRGRRFMGRSIEAVTRSGGGNEWRLALPEGDPAARPQDDEDEWQSF